MSDRQLDLFELSSGRPDAVTQTVVAASLDVEALGDDALVAALPEAGLLASGAIVREVGRRQLASAIPALAALCLRYSGFGRDKIVPQQKEAAEALGVIGGREASQALAQLVERGAFEGPGLEVALREAVRLASPLSETRVATFLRADNPAVRAAAARCVRAWPRCAPLLIDLLQDLHADVCLAAACALGRLGNAAARPSLLSALRDCPSPDVIEAAAGIYDDEVLVLLGRTAESRPDLAGPVRDALEGIDQPRAAAIAARIGR
jgi:HEAT repeat protein